MTNQEDFIITGQSCDEGNSIAAYDEECYEELEEVKKEDTVSESEEVKKETQKDVQYEYSFNFNSFYEGSYEPTKVERVEVKTVKIEPVTQKYVEPQKETPQDDEVLEEKQPVWILKQAVYKSPLRFGRVLVGIVVTSVAVALIAIMSNMI